MTIHHTLTDLQFAKMMKDFGAALRECREHLGVNQSDFATSLGYKGGSAISTWERGDGLPRAKTFFKLAKWMGISIDYLLGVATDRHNEQHRARARARKAG